MHEQRTVTTPPRRLRRLISLGFLCTVVGATAFQLDLGASKTDPLPSTTDPALLSGTLPNGMRYYIRHNALPAKRANLWLAVNAGAIQEDDDQLGLAHFLEHMAFNGSKSFPGNTLVDVVEQSGMTFGADLNAYTSFDETVYQLTMPTDDSKLFQQGLQIIDDWASGGLLMDSAEVTNERGVVLGEWRSRLPDTAAHRIQTASLERMFGKGSRYVDRLPIGNQKSIESATPSVLNRFYHDWYRPDLMAIVAVGDFDAKAVEKEIIERFSKIPKAAAPRQFTRPVVDGSAKTVVTVVKDRLNPQVDMTWPAPTPGTSDAAMRQNLLEQILFPAVQQTLTKFSKQDRRPFVSATIGRTAGFARPHADQYKLQITSTPDSLKDALAVALAELERVAQHGIPKAELDAQKAAILRQYEGAADEVAAIPSRKLAERYTQHYLKGTGQLWSAEQALKLARTVLPTITSKDVMALAKQWQKKENRNITFILPSYMSGIRPVTEENVLTLIDSLTAVKLASSSPAVTSKADKNSILKTVPKSGKVVKEETVASVGVTTWTLSNGARVVFKQTANNPDEVTLNAYSLGGHSLLPDSTFHTASRLVGMLMTASGGLAGKTHDQLQKDLGTTGLREFRVDLNAFDESIVVGGSPKELETLFQLMHLQFTNPTIDTTALAEWRRTGGTTLTMNANDRLAFGLSGNKRLSTPQVVNVPFVNLTQAMTVYRERFGDASDFTFYVVGAAPASRIKPLVERYIASLPSTNRTEREVGKNLKIKLPKDRQVSQVRSPMILAEQAYTSLNFFGELTATKEDYVKERSRIDATSWILGRRLLKRLREDMAVTYSVSAPVQYYMTPEDRYVVSIALMTAPEVMDTSVKAMWHEIDSLRTYGPTADELAMAQTVQRRFNENAQQDNNWWIAQMQRYERLGIPFSQLSAATAPSFTAADIQTAANQTLSKTIYSQQTTLPTLENIAKRKKEQDGQVGGSNLANR